MTIYIWIILGLLVLGLTKYLTSLWLKGLQNRTRQTNQAILELKETVTEKQKRADELSEANTRLRAKESVLTHLVGNLENTLRTTSNKPPTADDTDPPAAGS